MTIREIQTTQIPLLLTKDKGADGKEAFLLSCKPLSIFIQAESKEEAETEFDKATHALFKHLINQKKLLRFLKNKNLIQYDVTRTAKTMEKIEEIKKLEGKIKEAQIKKPSALELGSFSEAELELA